MGGSTSFPGSFMLGKKDPGRFPFDQNFRKFRFKIEWNRKFPENLFENFGQALEVVLFFRKFGNSGNFAFHFTLLLGMTRP